MKQTELKRFKELYQRIHTIPDILKPIEIERIIGGTRKLSYRVFY